MKTRNQQVAHYKGKKIKLPFNIPTQWFSSEEITQANHLSGQQTTLPKFAGAVRNQILIAEQQATMEDKRLGWGGSKHWDKVRKGLDWFRQYFASQYMVLLD
jgi:hypothetical protein